MQALEIKYPKYGAGLGLHRVQAIARDLQIDPCWFAMRSCNIAGSNGKGSVTAVLSAMLTQAQRGVGRFTSPHLFDITERFAIDDVAVSRDELWLHWREVEQAVDHYVEQHPGDTVGGFEFLYLVALSLFHERTWFAVFECGVGGRYDPTRLAGPKIAAVVSLDLEHTELLGKTLVEIAYDKIDTCANGGRIYFGESAGDLRAQIETYCGLREVTPIFLRAGEGWRPVAETAEGVVLDIPVGGAWARLISPLRGAHQFNNVAIAAHIATDILGQSSVEAMARGAAEVVWPGRLETIANDPLTIIDVGHTPQAIRNASAGLKTLFGDRTPILVTGVSIDKCADEIAASLADQFGDVVCTRAHHKGRAAAEIAAMFRARNPSVTVHAIDDIAAACALAIARARAQGSGIYVAGGLFVAIEFEAVLRGRDPRLLRFF